MKKEIKALTLLSITSALFISIGVTFLAGQETNAHAVECEHEGNHYTVKKATTKTSGVKEYWVCCNCHQHYLEEPEGTWVDAGIANIIISSSDDRYIPKTNSYNEDGFKLSEDGKTIVDYNDKSSAVVIPEGVETIGSGAFNGSDVSSVTLPSTLKEIEENAFKNTDNLTSIVIPGSVEDIAANAFLDDPNGFGYLLGQGRDITIYLEITESEAKAKFESGWDNAGAQYIFGSKVGETKAKVYYKDEWHYDSKGNPTPNK